MPTPSPIFGWPLPTLGETADGPAAFAALAGGIETTLTDSTISTYLPTWTSRTGGTAPANAASKSGQYHVENKWCDFTMVMTFGPSTSGGTSDLFVGLPVRAAPTIPTQLVNCLLYIPGGASVWLGTAFIDSDTNWNSMRPHFPISNARSDALPWASYGSPLGGGVSVPQPAAGVYSVQNGGSFFACGRYRTE